MALAEGLQTVSHDGLTKLLQADWSGPTLLELAWRTLFACERGALLVDDTVLPKPFATAIEGLAWLYSRQERKPIYGLSLVLLVWTNGTLRAQSEEGIRVCTNPLGLSGCQARSTRAQAPHVTCGLVTCWVLERERHDRGLTIYKLKRQLSGHGRMLALPGLEQLRQTA
jgi:hypothetical protein